MMKNANVKVASHTTIALMGRLPSTPYMSNEIGQMYSSELTNTVVIANSQDSMSVHLKTYRHTNTEAPKTTNCASP